jgi:DNA-binding transcriptional LysR family regulator
MAWIWPCGSAIRVTCRGDGAGAGHAEDRALWLARLYRAARHGGPVDDLPAHDLIATARHGTVTAWQVLGDHGERRSFRPETRLLLDGSLLTLAAIRAGHGLGQVPRWLVEEDLADGRLIPVLEDRMVGHLPVHALWRSAPVMLPRLRVVIDAAAMAVRRGLRDA